MNLLKNEDGLLVAEIVLLFPLYLMMFVFLVDTSQFLLVQPRLLGCARLNAELRASNHGGAVSGTEIAPLFFDDYNGRVSNLEFKTGSQLSTVADTIKDLTDGFVGDLVNIFSFGYSDKLFVNVVTKDIFFSCSASADLKPLLPVSFHQRFLIPVKGNGVMPVSPGIRDRSGKLLGYCDFFPSRHCAK